LGVLKVKFWLCGSHWESCFKGVSPPESAVDHT